MATMSVACQCGRTWKTGLEHAGRRAKCPACGQMIQIPTVVVPSDPPAVIASSLEHQLPVSKPPPIDDLASGALPGRGTLSGLRARHPVAVGIAVGVLTLCIIGVTISVAVSRRAAPQPLRQADPALIGKKVVQKYADFELHVENQAVSSQSIIAYEVEQVDGPFVLLKAEEGRRSGWSLADQIVPIDEGIDFFKNQIRANPRDAFSYAMRAILWQRKNELDISLGDLNEAIRLNPQDAFVHNIRGSAWADRKEYDKAIADFDEAIHLDPQYTGAYCGRGAGWLAKGDNDKAIADFNEAIRLDPQSALAYSSRGWVWVHREEYDKAIAEFNEAIRLEPHYGRAYCGRGAVWLAWIPTVPEFANNST